MVSESTPRREGRRRAEPIVLASYYTLAGAALPENQGGTDLSPWDVAAHRGRRRGGLPRVRVLESRPRLLDEHPRARSPAALAR
jgi:hypothetical protein